MIRIQQQSDLENARKAVDFCYLCGEDLPAVRKHKNGCSPDHIVPRSILRQVPAKPAWPLILDVHNKCHCDKSKNDNVLCSMSQMMYRGGIDLSENSKGAIRNVFEELSPKIRIEGMVPVRMRANFVEGGWDWARGCFAALYGEYLPRETNHSVFSPGREAFDRSSEGISLESLAESAQSLDQIKIGIARGVAAMAIVDSVDLVASWGSSCVFACFWSQYKGAARCRWLLSLPGDVAFGIGSGGPLLPWTGAFDLAEAPGDARLYSDEEVLRACEVLEARTQANSLVDVVPLEVLDADNWVIWPLGSGRSLPAKPEGEDRSHGMS